MKRKVKKFAGDEGSVVRTRSDKEFEEDSKYGGYGRYMPKTKEYTVDEVKDKLVGLFGGKKEDTSKFDDLKSVGEKKVGVSPQEEINRQIRGSKSEPKADTEAPTRKFSDYNKTDSMSVVDKKDAPYEVEKAAPVKRRVDAPIAAPKAASPKAASPKAASPKAASPKADALKADKKADVSKTAESKYEYPKNAKPLKTITNEEKAAIKKRGEQDDADQESLRKQLEKNIADNKAAADQLKKDKPADAPKKTEKRYGQGLTPYEKGRTLSEYSKMLGGGKKETTKETSKSSSKDDDEKLAATRRRAAGMFQKTNEGVYGMKKGGSVSSASSRGDGIAARGKTRGKIC